MAHLDTLIDRISDPKLRSEIQEQVSKLAAKTSFGLVFEEHRPETVAVMLDAEDFTGVDLLPRVGISPYRHGVHQTPNLG